MDEMTEFVDEIEKIGFLNPSIAKLLLFIFCFIR